MKKIFGNFEFLFLMLFFFCIIAWAVSKCSDKQQELLAHKHGPVPARSETSPTNHQENTATNLDSLAQPSVIRKPKPVQPTIKKIDRPILYVTLDGLKMRKEAKIKGELVEQLQLNDKVYFLEERTEYRDTFRLETGESVGEPWLKIKTQSGKEGWAWGAGLHYYKMNRLKEK